MIEVTKNLYVGQQADYEEVVKESKEAWYTIHACKEPYHRQAIGYTTRGAPKDSPEYYYAYRKDRLILNLVDADNKAYIPDIIVLVALTTIRERLSEGYKVLLHCNQGLSRSPALALLYMHRSGEYAGMSLEEAEKEYKEVYPMYAPAAGMLEYLRDNW